MTEYKTFIFKSRLGDIHCIFENNLLIRVVLEDSSKNIKAVTHNYLLESDLDSINPDKDFSSLGNELQLYFNGLLRQFNQPVKFINGTVFEQNVWLKLKEIPYGETRTYKWLAEKVGCPKAFRAVGNALNKNPLSIILPCHRIVGSDGSLCGYSAGLELKRRLLKHESGHILSDSCT